MSSAEMTSPKSLERMTKAELIKAIRSLQAAIRQSLPSVNELEAKTQQQPEAGLANLMRLHEASSRFIQQGNLHSLLERILDAAISVTVADMGIIQLLDGDSDTLRIATQFGFAQVFLDFFARVRKGQWACGIALEKEERVIVEDITKSPIFAGTPALEILLEAGVCAVQSTPLFTHTGRLLGVFSIYYRVPRQPDEGDLRLLDLLAQQAADFIERFQADEKLRQSEERFRTLFEQASDGISVTEAHSYRFLDINSAACRMLGYSREELLSLSITDVIAEDELPRLESESEKLLGGELVRSEWCARRQDGSLFPCEARAKQLPDGRIQTFLHDITQRKLAEEALRESEALKQAILSSLAAQIAVLDNEGKLIAVNEAWKRFAQENGSEGSSPGLGENYMHVCHKACLENDGRTPEVLAGIQSVLDGIQSSFTLEYPCHSPQEERWFLMTVTPLQGELGGAVIAHTNISKRKQAEQALQGSEARLGGIINSAMDAIISVDDQQRIVLFNRAAERMFGYSSEEVLGQSLARFVPAKFRDAHEGHIRRFGATGETTRAMGGPNAVSGMRSNGEEFPIEASISQIEAHGQQLFTVILRDITERVRASERLIEHATLLDQSHEAIIVRDLDGRIRYWGRGAEQLYGWTAEEVIGRSSEDLYYRNDLSPLGEAARMTIENGKWNGELSHIAKDGREVIVEGHWTLVRDTEGKPKSILAINTDVTEKKKLEANFLRAQRLESIGTLASGIAHDLNNILSPIMMGAQMLQMKLHDDQSRRLLGVMQTSANRGAEMIKQVLSFAKGVSGQRVVLQPKHLIREIVRIAEETFPKSIRIQQRLAEELWTINGDATQLQQVLLNLCVNARDAMRDGGTLTIAAENQLLDKLYAQMLKGIGPGNFIVITVTDTGMGISSEIIDRIFDPFFTTKEPGQGTGLGLASVQGIVASHGGFVTVESKPGLGTKFSIYLPSNESVSQQKAIESDLEMPLGAGELILVVDDEAAVREMTSAALEAFGYRTLTADNGATALSIFASHMNEVSLVITDLMMPVMDGMATIRSLRKMNPDIRVLASSGLADEAKVGELRMLQVENLLEKPYNAESLMNSVAKALRKRPPSATNF